MSIFDILTNATITYYAGRAIVEASENISQTASELQEEYVYETYDQVNQAIESLNDTGLTTGDDPLDFWYGGPELSDTGLLASLLGA